MGSGQPILFSLNILKVVYLDTNNIGFGVRGELHAQRVTSGSFKGTLMICYKSKAI